MRCKGTRRQHKAKSNTCPQEAWEPARHEGGLDRPRRVPKGTDRWSNRRDRETEGQEWDRQTEATETAAVRQAGLPSAVTAGTEGRGRRHELAEAEWTGVGGPGLEGGREAWR